MKDLAYYSAKKINSRDDAFLQSRNFINELEHVDQMWDYLNHKNGNVLAVKNLRGNNKEEFNYSQLNNKITKASKAFFNLGLRRGEVVSLISENSPRWLIADQAIMRISAIDAVRGSNSPSIEIEYIIQHSKSVGLIIESKVVWEKLAIKNEIIENLKFLIVLEDESFGEFLGWNKFLEIGNNNTSVYTNLIIFGRRQRIAGLLVVNMSDVKGKTDDVARIKVNCIWSPANHDLLTILHQFSS